MLLGDPGLLWGKKALIFLDLLLVGLAASTGLLVCSPQLGQAFVGAWFRL